MSQVETTPWHDAVELPDAPAWLADLRAAAFGRFESMGWPARDEGRYRYSDLRLLRDAPPGGPSRTVCEADLEPFLAGDEAARLVFVDGHHDAGLSDVSGVPTGVRMVPVADAHDDLRGELERLAQSDDPLVVLNTATFQDGAYVHVPAGQTVPGTLHVVHVTTGAGLRVTQDTVRLDEDAEATVLESHIHLADNDGRTLHHTTLRAAPAARLRHVKIQKEDRRAVHAATQDIVQDRDSTLQGALLDLGGHRARQGIQATLAGSGASCDLRGVFFGQRNQRRDVWTRIDHAVPNCTSNETFKGILDDESLGAFTGLIAVHEGAHGTRSDQQNRNLLLSNKAHADATPQLEILNDDVRCSHGSTIGQLDENALFFLRSRGIGKQQARLMLTRAFASDVIQAVGSAPIRKLMDRYLHVWFIKHQEHL